MSRDVPDRIIPYRGELTEEQLAVIRARWEATKHGQPEILRPERKSLLRRVRRMLAGLLSCEWHECDHVLDDW